MKNKGWILLRTTMLIYVDLRQPLDELFLNLQMIRERRRKEKLTGKKEIKVAHC